MDRVLFDEAVCLVFHHFDKSENTIFIADKEILCLIATTMNDEDEKDFLKNAVEKKFKDDGFNFVSMEEQRQDVRGMLIIPIRYGNDIIGIWIMEDYQAEVIHISSDDECLLKLFSFFAGAYLSERRARENLYLDPLINVPGRVYFENMIGDLMEREVKMYVCAVKYCNMRMLNAMYGIRHCDQSLQRLAKAMLKEHIGTVHRIDDSTFAMITFADKIRVHDIMKALINDVGKCMDLKVIMLHSKEIEDIFLDMERGFERCPQGSIWIMEEDILQQEVLFTIDSERGFQKKQKRGEFDSDLFKILQEAKK